MSRVAIIGSGFSGLSAACFLAQAGFDVTVFEKNDTVGGRARKFEASGFTFDMGPSWYWMPDVFENFFRQFDKKPSDYYDLVRLDPSYRIHYAHQENLDIPAGIDALASLCEQLEPGGARQLQKFLKEGEVKYNLAMKDLVYKPGLSITEFFSSSLIKGLFHLHVFESMTGHIQKYFQHPKLIQLLEFPVLFLGAKPEKTPALYSLMNYADMQLGTWYPRGGMYKVIDGMVALAKSLGVKFSLNSAVEKIDTAGSHVRGVVVGGASIPFNYVVASCDYHHTEQQLLPPDRQQYTAAYWQNRTLAPSCLIYFVGLRKKMKGLLHHNLFFDEDFKQHAREIYDIPQWPTTPQFYVCCPSKTDSTVAPEGCENIFILIPVAPGLTDDSTQREKYLKLVLDRIARATGENLQDDIIFQRSYAHRDFIQDYNAFKGNAYGLANTLQQTANLKPSIVNKKVGNLFYTGQLTVPGPGVPPAIISGQVAATQLIKTHRESVT